MCEEISFTGVLRIFMYKSISIFYMCMEDPVDILLENGGDAFE
jgi:hypothetical protein